MPRSSAPAMDQGSLFGPPPPSLLRVWTDYGEVGPGATRPHYVLGEDGTEYLIKGPTFTPEQPTVAGNEWLAANLAQRLALPVLPSRLLSMDGALFFGSLWMSAGTFAPGIEEDLFRRCEN